MKNLRAVIVSFIALLIPIILSAQITNLSQMQNALSPEMLSESMPVEQTTPVRLILESNSNQIIIQYKFSGFSIAPAIQNSELYQYIHIMDFPKMGQVGKPALPVHNDIIMLPGGSAQIQIIEAPYHEYPGFNIYPALEDASDEAGQPEPVFVKDQNLYSTNAFWPADIVSLETQQKIRTIDFAIIQIRPVQYNPVTKMIRVYDYIKYKVVYSGSNLGNGEIRFKSSNSFINSIRDGVLNSNLLPAKSENTTKTLNSNDIILLTTPAYQAAADTLAMWKRQLGYTVKIITSSTWTSAAVKDTVHTLYQNWNPHPDYLLILGDDADVPSEHIPYSTTYYLSDLYYVCMDGVGDYLADMARGRISVNSASQAMTVVQKIVNYERNPISDASFYNNIMSCAYFQDGSTYTSYKDGYADRRFLHTAEEIRSYLMTKSYSVSRTYFAFDNRVPTNYNNGYYSDGQAIPSDLLVSNGFNWNGGSSDITSKINAGAFLLYHRDHGYVGGYGWEHPYYLNQESSSLVGNGDNINQLSNGSKLPVVFSVNCYTGDFSKPECFAENFIRKSDGGAVGVFAPSYASYSGYNDALITGMMDAIWSNPGLIPDFGAGGTSNPNLNTHGDILTMGDVLNQGLLRMVQTWAASSKWQMQNEIYHYFGDPSMKIWTASPAVIATNEIKDIVRLDSSITIQSQNCSDAFYTLMVDGEVIASGNLVNGQVNIEFLLDSIHDAVLTISKHNFRPIVKKFTIDNTIKSIPPISQASNIRFIAEGAKSTSITIEWDKGDGDFSMVKISDDGSFATPIDGTEYLANDIYNGSGEQVVFTGEGNSVTVYNLQIGSAYWFRVYDYNNEGVYTLYQTISDVDNPNVSDGGSMLPVQLTDLKAEFINESVEIEWITNSEVNNEKFIIEKSINGYDFTSIGEVPGFGNSNIPITYKFTDLDIKSGVIYYRLNQMDFDGKMTVSQPIMLKLNNNQMNSLIENYSVNENGINILCSNMNENIELRIIDMTGRIVNTMIIEGGVESSEIQIPINNLMGGVYFISARTSTLIDNRKVIIN